MKKGKLKGLLILVLVLIAVTACGSVYAYMIKQTNITNNFTPAKVSCEVEEKTDNPVTEKSSITVKNTSNIDAYLRVRLVSYWVKDAGAGTYVVGKESVMPTFTIKDDWIAGSDYTYYYKSPVAPGDDTKELLDSKIVLAADGEYLQVVEVFAEAIQSEPSKAVTESWGLTLDANGLITGAP